MGLLDGLVLEFKEQMSGFVAISEQKRTDSPIRFDAEIRIDDLGRFLRLPDHTAALGGTVTFPALGGTFPMRDGRFNLFSIDPSTGVRQMVYQFRFTAADGQTYFLDGHKEIQDDRGRLDAVADMTRLFTKVHRGEDAGAPVYATGELRFNLLDAPAMALSMEVRGAKSWYQKVAALAAFSSFAFGALRDEYLRDIRLCYDTQYENLVLAGTLRGEDGVEAPFFLVSGTHDRGFPWGDTELFWDVLLAVGDGRGGYRRYAITDRILEGLELDITTGSYRYRGPIFRLAEGYSTAFSEMRAKTPQLTACQADFHINFQARAFDTLSFPFPLVDDLVRKMSSSLVKALREALPGKHALGINITPHAVNVSSGELRIDSPQGGSWAIVPERSSGECERGTMRNVKEPTMLYSYLCAVSPARRAARVQIITRTLRDEREQWVKDRLDAFIGTVVSRTASAEVLLEGGRLTVKPLPPAGKPKERAAPLRKLNEPVIEVNNDHYPTAVFQRRIVEVEDVAGQRCLALEEDMCTMRLEPIKSDREVTVAAIRDDDKFRALDRVLDETGFDGLAEARLAESGKPRKEMLIAIKPNFMFAYDKRDHTTYTDPELVHRLVRRLRDRGFETIRVVEAQSTYGEYFDKRGVREVADYLGYDGSAGYQVADMTLDATEQRNFGPHLGLHPVSSTWRDADLRISFAKNKTHAYSFYTLTLKNIYGALPLANKFKEYHCNRDIYHTTMEYLTAFPVHYGLVDAHVSADGPFGIFADPGPNLTKTVIGGGDLVAVDWVAATKMGLDPMISKYMKLAVDLFGKPRIRLVGDAGLYRPWLNVPVALTLFTHKGLDAEHFFGNLFYSACAQMDEGHFQHKSNAWHIRLLRHLTVEMRRTFFLRTGENPSLGNRLASWVFYRLGF